MIRRGVVDRQDTRLIIWVDTGSNPVPATNSTSRGFRPAAPDGLSRRVSQPRDAEAYFLGAA